MKFIKVLLFKLFKIVAIVSCKYESYTSIFFELQMKDLIKEVVQGPIFLLIFAHSWSHSWPKRPGVRVMGETFRPDVRPMFPIKTNFFTRWVVASSGGWQVEIGGRGGGSWKK